MWIGMYRALMVLIIDVIVGSQELFSLRSRSLSLSLSALPSNTARASTAQCFSCCEILCVEHNRVYFCSVHMCASITAAWKETYTNNKFNAAAGLWDLIDGWNFCKACVYVHTRSCGGMFWFKAWVNLKLIASYITNTEFIQTTCVWWCVTKP